MLLMHQQEASNSSFVAKLAVINLIGQLGCDRQMVRPVTFQVLPPFSKHFLQALFQTDMRDKSKGFRKLGKSG